MEYNAKFAPPISYCMNYNSKHNWNYTDCGGASLKFLEEKAKDKGYSLAGCCLSGVNAFFVKSELADGKFGSPFTAEKHYEPFRSHFSKIRPSHPTSFNTLETAIID